MPYIKQAARVKFKPVIDEILSQIISGSESRYVKGEYFGYYVNRLVKYFLQSLDAPNQSFNSMNFPEPKRKALNVAVDRLAAYLNKSDPIEGAGELNYAITSVLWGLTGDAEGLEPSGYGHRAYLTGMLDVIREDLKNCRFSATSNPNPILNFRRYWVCVGVLNDVINENYRRRTAPYEDGKIAENGDVWAEGKLVVGDPIFPS
jgi:hypothetical protein